MIWNNDSDSEGKDKSLPILSMIKTRKKRKAKKFIANKPFHLGMKWDPTWDGKTKTTSIQAWNKYGNGTSQMSSKGQHQLPPREVIRSRERA